MKRLLCIAATALLVLSFCSMALEILSSATIDTVGTSTTHDTLQFNLSLTALGTYDTISRFDTIAHEKTLPIDAVVMIDNSSSMGSGPGSKMDQAKKAASRFAALLSNDTNRISIFQFNTVIDSSHWMLCSLTSDSTVIAKAIDTITTQSGTPLYQASVLGMSYLQQELIEAHSPVLIILTDGQNYATSYTRDQAYAALSAGWNSDSVRTFTIGFGDRAEIDRNFLDSAALVGHGATYRAPDSATLDSAYRQIRRNINITTIDTLYTETPVLVIPTIAERFVDLALVMDNSSSMGSSAGSKLEQSKTAAQNFCNIIMNDDSSRMAVYEFNENVAVANWQRTGFTTDAQVVANAISGIAMQSGTPLYRAILTSLDYVIANRIPGHAAALAILTDGENSREAELHDSVMAALDAAYRDHDIVTYLIGFGDTNYLDAVFMQEAATAGGGEYVFAPDSAALDSVFNALGGRIIRDVATLNFDVTTNLPNGAVFVAGSNSVTSTSGLDILFNAAGLPATLHFSTSYIPVWEEITLGFKVVVAHGYNPATILSAIAISFDDENGQTYSMVPGDTVTIGENVPTVIARYSDHRHINALKQTNSLRVMQTSSPLWRLVSCTISKQGTAQLAAYDLGGRLVQKVKTWNADQGVTNVPWNIATLRSGSYCIRLSTATGTVSRLGSVSH